MSLARRAVERFRDLRLEREQARGVLGPAHRAWKGNSARDNEERWRGWDWGEGGEEWSVSPEWKQSLVDEVLLDLIPEGASVLEIGPGAGRWSVVLAPRAERLVLVDVTPRVLEVCRERLGDLAHVSYVRSSGSDLPGVADASIDAVWSFDVFVHVAPLDQAGYLAEIARVLRPGGTAAIHHADGRNRGALPSRRGWRSPMSAGLFAALAEEHGLDVRRQVRSWSEGRHDLSAFADVISVLERRA
ncbi:MAG TPA: class I SAM-dependent methyltransferase [Thermoleophilaceae bacterium]|nr:class I SAM-dependent methyltransferase [Thermoleophilaceae bacterium]